MASVLTPPADTRVSASTRRWAIIALALGGFGIGTTEFVAMGLLPNIADSVHVSEPTAGYLISAYALGVVVGAPLIAALTARMSRRTLLIALMVAFTVATSRPSWRRRMAGSSCRGSLPASRTAPTSASRRWWPPTSPVRAIVRRPSVR